MDTRLLVKRIYDPIAPDDGARVLVDRLWPRGVSREKAALSDWARELTPSTELRQAFHQGTLPFALFEAAYIKELEESQAAQQKKQQVLALLQKGPVTLLTANRDMEQNHALVLRDWLLRK